MTSRDEALDVVSGTAYAWGEAYELALHIPALAPAFISVIDPTWYDMTPLEDMEEWADLCFGLGMEWEQIDQAITSSVAAGRADAWRVHA